MRRLSLALVFLLLPMRAAYSAQPGEEEYKTMAMMVATLKNIVQWSMTRKQVQSALVLVPNSKPLYKDGLYQGQVFIYNGRETGFIHVSYRGEKAAVAAYSTAPMRSQDTEEIYRSYTTAMELYYRKITAKKFDLGDGLIAELENRSKKMSVFVLRE